MKSTIERLAELANRSTAVGFEASRFTHASILQAHAEYAELEQMNLRQKETLLEYERRNAELIELLEAARDYVVAIANDAERDRESNGDLNIADALAADIDAALAHSAQEKTNAAE